MRLLQICNVGNICGGTAACAWTISHALPGDQHTVNFFSPPTAETRQAFRHCRIDTVAKINNGSFRSFHPDLIILHNTSADRFNIESRVPVIQFQHSAGQRAQADMHVACSKWLTNQIAKPVDVLYQPVPIPSKPATFSKSRSLDEEIIIGRICTPTARKWPQELLPFYENLTEKFPQILWEFVGAPEAMQKPLATACSGRVRFHPPGFSARSLLWNWHAMLYHHPTLTESFGRTVAEAMRAACIPIVDARGGFLEQIVHEKSGFLCSSAEEFSSALKTILDPTSRYQVSKSATELANQRFSLETFHREFARIKKLLL